MSDQNSGQTRQNSGQPQETSNGPDSTQHDQNSAAVAAVDALTTPESIQDKYGIGKSAYYDDLKFLKGQGHPIHTHRDAEKRTILEPETVLLISALREHVALTGSREGFQYGGELAVAEDAAGLDASPQTPEPEFATGTPLDEMVRQAQQLAAQNLVMGNLVVAEMARQIGYEDLPTDLKQQVDQARAATLPKTNPAEVASSLLSRWAFEQNSHQRGESQTQTA